MLKRMAGSPRGQRARLAPALAGASGSMFWIAAGLIAAGLVRAVLLPGRPRAAAAVPGQRAAPRE
jgi:hypothetical protein